MFDNQTITVTLCDQAENHVGMQKLGIEVESGFGLEDLFQIKNWFEQNGAVIKQIELLDLNHPLQKLDIYPDDEAYILIVRNGVDILLGNNNATNLFLELKNLEWDSKALMYGRVVNKHARHNLCFGEQNQEPNYDQGHGRIIAFNDIPLLNKIKKKFSQILGTKGENLVAEGNLYYDITKCGIGFHGDSERKIVIGIRLGESLPLEYQWFYNSEQIGERISLQLDHGDIYFMSDKATGNDWKKKSIYTLRHAAGANKYLKQC